MFQIVICHLQVRGDLADCVYLVAHSCGGLLWVKIISVCVFRFPSHFRVSYMCYKNAQTMKVIIFLKIALIGASFAVRNTLWPLAEPETCNTPSKYEKRKDRHNYGYILILRCSYTRPRQKKTQRVNSELIDTCKTLKGSKQRIIQQAHKKPNWPTIARFSQ